MGEMPDGTFEFDEPPKGGAHSQAWMDLTSEERVIHYNRNRPKGTAKVLLYSWLVELIPGYSYDPYFNSPQMMPHTPAGFFDGTCECQMCVSNIGIERGSRWEYAKRKKR